MQKVQVEFSKDTMLCIFKGIFLLSLVFGKFFSLLQINIGVVYIFFFNTELDVQMKMPANSVKIPTLGPGRLYVLTLQIQTVNYFFR